MPKPATGAIRLSKDGYVAHITIQGRERRSFALTSCRTEAEAEERARVLAQMARQFRKSHVTDTGAVKRLLEMAACCADAMLKGVLQVAGELCGGDLIESSENEVQTFRELAKEWTSGKLHERFPDDIKEKDSDLDEARLKTLCAIDVGGIAFGDIPLNQVTLTHARTVMSKLPGSARRPATRRHYAQLLNRVLNLAVYPCEVIKSSPLPARFVPKAGKPPKYPYLYPSEDRALLACQRVPLASRFFYGFLAREGMRTGEALALQFRDLDLTTGTVSIDENKTDDPRTWALDPGVRDALKIWQAMRHARPDDQVFAGVDLAEGDRLAEALRRHLLAAGVSRRQLHHTGTNTRPMRAHDLRGTFVTLSLANGKTESWVSDRTGHQSSQMINRYRRAATSGSELALGQLDPLDRALPEIRLPNVCQIGLDSNTKDDLEARGITQQAEVAELADAADSKSAEATPRIGSTPIFGTQEH